MSRPRIAVLPVEHPWARRLIEVVERAGGAVAVPEEADAIVWTDPSDPEGLGEALASSPARWVQLPFAGIESFFAAGVIDPARTWTCMKGAYGPACAEQALGLIILGARLFHRHARATSWMTGDRMTAAHDHRRLAGTTALIVGTGGIGRALAAMLAPLSVRVLGVSRSGEAVDGFERVERVGDLSALLPDADWVVIAAPHTVETSRLFDAAMLDRMRDDAWLINVARGPLVDTDALVEALRAGRIGGAALDVTDPEPLPDGHPLWRLENAIVLSHTSNTARMAGPELRAAVARNVARFARGEPLEGLVDPGLGY